MFKKNARTKKPKKHKKKYWVLRVLKCWLLCCINVVWNVHEMFDENLSVTFHRIEIFMFAISWTDPLYNHENWSKIAVNKSEKPFHFSGSFVWFMYSKDLYVFRFTRRTEELENKFIIFGFICLCVSMLLLL